MQKHTKIYMDHFGYSVADFIPCENCGAQCIDVHHLEPRGMGGSKKKNNIENLMALCRSCHDKAHASRDFNLDLKLIHRRKLLGVKKDNETVRYI